MEHAASPSLITLGPTPEPSSEGSSIRWGLAASFILHVLVIVIAMFVRFESEKEQSFRAIDVALISLPSMPMTAPSQKSVAAHTKKSAVVQAPQKVIPPPPVEATLAPLQTESASERLSESLGGAINSIIVPQKQKATSTPVPSQKPNLRPSEGQPALLGNLQLPSAPPTISRPKPLQRTESLNISATPPPKVVPRKTPTMSKPRSLQSPTSVPKAQPDVKPAPVLPSFSEVTSFKKSLPKTTSLKTRSAPNIEEALKRSLPDVPRATPRRHSPQVSRKLSKIKPNQESSIPHVSAPPFVKIPESPQSMPEMPPSSQSEPATPSPPKMTNMVRELMKGLKLTTRPPAPKQAPLQPIEPVTASSSIKSPSSAIDQRIAQLAIPEVAPVESIKQRLSQIQVQSLPDASTSASPQESPAENRYFAMIRESIDRRWRNPDVPIKNKKVIITFQVEKSGEISKVHVEQSSGNTYYDSTILGAIYEENPLPKFPSDLKKSFLNIKFLFTMPEQ